MRSFAAGGSLRQLEVVEQAAAELDVEITTVGGASGFELLGTVTIEVPGEAGIVGCVTFPEDPAQPSQVFTDEILCSAP